MFWLVLLYIKSYLMMNVLQRDYVFLLFRNNRNTSYSCNKGSCIVKENNRRQSLYHICKEEGNNFAPRKMRCKRQYVHLKCFLDRVGVCFCLFMITKSTLDDVLFGSVPQSPLRILLEALWNQSIISSAESVTLMLKRSCMSWSRSCSVREHASMRVEGTLIESVRSAGASLRIRFNCSLVSSKIALTGTVASLSYVKGM